LHEIEIIINVWLQGLGRWLLAPMQFFSLLGTTNVLLVIMAWIYWCMDNHNGIRIALALLISTGFNTALKWFFHAPRPYWISHDVEALALESSFGFPSGHAMMGATFWGRIALWVKRNWFSLLAAIILSLIGLSRIYLGVHFFSDVIAGWLFGFSLLIILFRVEKPISYWLLKKSIQAQISLFFQSSIIILVFFLFIQFLLKEWRIPTSWLTTARIAGPNSIIDPIRLKDIFSLSGLWFGTLTGYALIQKSGGFCAKGSIIVRIIRFLVGLSGMIVLLYLFGLIRPEKEWLTFGMTYVEYLFVSLWISGIAPMIFIKSGLTTKEVK
jgi:membrane-associated phospholipid phosphatase